MFEDDPAEYVRRDLEGSDSDTRRQAATNFTRALMEQFEKKVTEIITVYVQNHLQVFHLSSILPLPALPNPVSCSNTTPLQPPIGNPKMQLSPFLLLLPLAVQLPLVVSRPPMRSSTSSDSFLNTSSRISNLLPILPAYLIASS